MNNTSTNLSLGKVSLQESYRTSLIIWMVIILTINILGMMANGVILIATMTYGPLRKSSSRLLLANCMIFDLLITTCTEPGLVLVTYYGYTALPRYFCRGWGAFTFFTFFANNWAHALLAINRFIAAVFPHHYRHFTTRPALMTAVIFPWLFAGVVNVFPVAEISLRFELAKVSWTTCSLGTTDLATPRTVLLSLGTYLPCAIIGLCYSIVLIKARISIRRRVGDKVQQTVLRRRNQTSKLLFLCFLWYCLANFAVPTSNSFFPVAYSASPLTQLSLKGLQYVSSAVNPVFFIAVSRKYQEGVIAVLKCHICRAEKYDTNGKLSKANQKKSFPASGIAALENEGSLE